MPRPPKPPSRLHRARRPVMVLLLIAVVVTIALGIYGLAAAAFALLLGIATFGSGPPTDNRSTRATFGRDTGWGG